MYDNGIENQSDEAVLAASVSNPETFSLIIDRYQEAFIRKASSVLFDHNDASDVVQEAFVRIYVNAKKFKVQEGATFGSWAYKILLNQCYTLYQKRKKEKQKFMALDEELLEVIPDAQNASLHDKKLNSEYVLSLVSKLPIILSRAVSLYFLQDFTQKEAAQIEGVSEQVLKARVHRGKQELRKLGLETLEYYG